MTTRNRLNTRYCTLRLFLLISLVLFASTLRAQQKSQEKPRTVLSAQQLLTRTVTRHETRRLGYGGTVTILGAPDGSIIIEGWPRSEMEVTAEIVLRAETEEDLSRLAILNSFAFVDDLNHVRILTTGTHDKAFMKRVAKNFPKKLLGLPWKVNYRLRVPAVTDVEINAGRGPITVAGVEGALTLTATESEAKLTLTGGMVNATVGTGNIIVNVPVRSWHGNGALIRLAAGDLTFELPAGFSGDIDADILRLGKIEATYNGLESRQLPGLTSQIVRARAGAGGASFKLIVGDGTIRIKKQATGQ